MAAPGPRSYPTAAFILTLIGGILILLDAVYVAALAAYVGSVGGVVLAAVRTILLVLAVVVMVLALIILFGAYKMRSDPGSARTWGVIVLIVALISFIGGGGFVLGLVLALIGGILAIVWHPPETAQPAWGAPANPMGGPPLASPAPAGQKHCGSCGSPNAATASTCAKCGAPLP